MSGEVKLETAANSIGATGSMKLKSGYGELNSGSIEIETGASSFAPGRVRIAAGASTTEGGGNIEIISGVSHTM